MSGLSGDHGESLLGRDAAGAGDSGGDRTKKIRDCTFVAILSGAMYGCVQLANGWGRCWVPA